MPDPRESTTATIEGRTTVVRPSLSGLPRKRDELLRQMARFGFAYVNDVKPKGARTACTQLREHRLTKIREGRWFAQDGIRRGEVLDLLLEMCQDCGVIKVTDVSIDVLDRGAIRQANPARGPLKRRHHVIGWYTGSRPANRVYT